MGYIVNCIAWELLETALLVVTLTHALRAYHTFMSIMSVENTHVADSYLPVCIIYNIRAFVF